MKVSDTQKFELSIITLSLLAAFAWGAYIGDSFPPLQAKEEPKVLGITTEDTQPPFPEAQDPGEYFKCTDNSDCVAVKKDCCGCEKGGEMIAVNRSMKEKYENSLICDQADDSCVEVNTCHPRETICDLGMCYLKVPTTNSPKLGDMDLNNEIDIRDYSLFLNDYLNCKNGMCRENPSNFNGDDEISIHDYYYFIDQLIVD